ncbi:MAG: hypothetical protein GAK29_04731 [Acinetobacter bereziniae]|uniref:Phage protein Gp138 N-terminal domain-containing protein n=1 Tax=Acinetobacter bereziniae TaxID=106648 RepID=A0A833P9W8_ACIBZ|nr:MAG: hypothetical protein GAK29_04731 [Acinetobacter bereziniae]
MALSFNELAPDQLSIVRDAIRAELANLWTSLPCEIDSYDSEAVTVNVQPLIKIPVMTNTGEIETVELPVIEDVPVMFPCAGGFTITHPINKGDECLVSFADRNIDLWWQSGGIQNPFDMRKHDLSDGFAFFRPQSQTKKISDISTENLEIRNDKNSCKIQITPGGEIHFLGSKAIFHCDVEMNKTLTVTGIIKSLSDVIRQSDQFI